MQVMAQDHRIIASGFRSLGAAALGALDCLSLAMFEKQANSTTTNIYPTTVCRETAGQVVRMTRCSERRAHNRGFWRSDVIGDRDK